MSPSLSARRAWIEIAEIEEYNKSDAVALRKESVDRNNSTLVGQEMTASSLSARRAWIEIGHCQSAACRKGSLSARRAWIEILQ